MRKYLPNGSRQYKVNSMKYITRPQLSFGCKNKNGEVGEKC